jgi:phosphoglucomutase
VQIDSAILKKAQVWLDENYDEETKKQIRNLIDNNPEELTESFYQDLEFGTGGLRGIMGVGTNRMNKYTVGMATQGLSNYLKKMFAGIKEIKVAIAYDSRNNSRYFAQITAEVFSANNIKVFLFEDLRPTPVLSFTIRELGCQSGVVITASHNPKEYNGYKVYWDDGGQLISPHDINVIKEVQKISGIADVKFEPVKENITIIGEDIDKIYASRVKELSLSQDNIINKKNLKIVYSALHGTGVNLVPYCLKDFGFSSVTTVKEQDVSDGNFPTIKSPNPEESAALSMAIEKAKEIGADLVMATDPDADRVGVAVKKANSEYVLLNGNQTATLMIYYLINKWRTNNKLKGREYIVKTIVTTELLKEIAIKNQVECFDVLTGFKFIADIIKKNEGKKIFIGGGEESYGYLAGEFVRDKDAVISCCIIAETAAWAAENGKSMYDLLIDIYAEYGFYKENLLSLTKKGKDGAEEIRKMMSEFRTNPPLEINGSIVTNIIDYLKQKEINILTGEEKPIDLPKSDVLQFFLKDKSKITVRPSGTEPKIKFYFGVREVLESRALYDKANESAENKIKNIINDMKLK